MLSVTYTNATAKLSALILLLNNKPLKYWIRPFLKWIIRLLNGKATGAAFCGNRSTVGSFMTNHNFPVSYTQILLTVDLTWNQSARATIKKKKNIQRHENHKLILIAFYLHLLERINWKNRLLFSTKIRTIVKQEKRTLTTEMKVAAFSVVSSSLGAWTNIWFVNFEFCSSSSILADCKTKKIRFARKNQIAVSLPFKMLHFMWLGGRGLTAFVIFVLFGISAGKDLEPFSVSGKRHNHCLTKWTVKLVVTF